MATELESVLEELKAMRKSVEEALARGTERPRLYTYEEAGRLLSVHPKTISRMVASGELLMVNVRGKKITSESIDRISTPEPKAKASVTKQPRFDETGFREQVKKARSRSS